MLCAISIAYFYYFYSYKNSGNNAHTIQLTEDGFVPSTLTIAKGDTVVFTTARDKPFWPASDLHPTHSIYPEFDPKQPVDSDKSWSFRFDKAGEWRFHDHLAPLFRGTITIRSADFTKASATPEVNCNDISSASSTSGCWRVLLTDAVKEHGVKQAFDIYETLYEKKPDFAENCHDTTHLIGSAAYDRFAKREDLNIGAQTQLAYCGYGFFHSFMETMMQREGNLDGAKQFCLELDKQFSNEIKVLGPCFHGIGHGVVDGSDPRFLGNANGLIQEGLALCEKVGRTDYEVKLCATGVFNSLAIMFLNAERFKLKLDPTDPYRFCRTLTDWRFKEACYEDFKIIPMAIEQNDFLKAARHVEKIQDDRDAFAAMDTIATYAVYYILRDPSRTEEAIRVCYQLQEKLWPSCIAGLGAGFMSAGVPNKEYKQALAVCQAVPIRGKTEREACFSRVGFLIAIRYPEAKRLEICATVEVDFRRYCSEAPPMP